MKIRTLCITIALFQLFCFSVYAENQSLKTAQLQLKSLGFQLGIADGFNGKRTENALREYQLSRHLNTTGKLNKETIQALENENKPIISAPTQNNNTRFNQRLSGIEKKLQTLINTQNQSITITPPKKVIINLDKYIPKPNDKKIVFRVVAKRGVKKTLKKWGPLANYLSSNIEGYYFDLQPTTLKALQELKEMDKTTDYFLGNPKAFVEFQFNFKFRPVVTLRNLRLGKAYDRFGIVLFTLKDSAINNLEDFKGKNIGMVKKNAWGGWVLGWHTLLISGIDPYKDMQSVESFGTHDNVIYAVRDGKVEIGNVRTDALERLSQEGKINLSNFKVIHSNTEYGDNFPFWLSSKLYPEWVFSASPKTNPVLNKKVAALLLSLDQTSPIAKAGKNDGWTIPANYQGVHTVLQDLKLPPYEHYGEITFSDVVKKYWFSLILALILLSILLIGFLYFRKLSSKFSKMNHNLIAAQTQLVQSEKMAGIGTMVAGITHEINTPLAFAKGNIGMVKDELDENMRLFKELYNNTKTTNKELTEETEELLEEIDDYFEDPTHYDMIRYVSEGLNDVSALVTSLKNYSRIDRAKNDVVDLHEGLDSTLLIAQNSIKHVAEIQKKYGEISKVQCSPSQINQVVMNLLMNAVHAIEEIQENNENYVGIVIIETWQENQYVFLRIADNGSGIKVSTIKKIFDPMFTTKVVGKGMGMGLALSKQIIENHNGTLTVESKENEGTAFIIKLPIKSKKDKNK